MIASSYFQANLFNVTHGKNLNLLIRDQTTLPLLHCGVGHENYRRPLKN